MQKMNCAKIILCTLLCLDVYAVKRDVTEDAKMSVCQPVWLQK